MLSMGPRLRGDCDHDDIGDYDYDMKMTKMIPMITLRMTMTENEKDTSGRLEEREGGVGWQWVANNRFIM